MLGLASGSVLPLEQLHPLNPPQAPPRRSRLEWEELAGRRLAGRETGRRKSGLSSVAWLPLISGAQRTEEGGRRRPRSIKWQADTLLVATQLDLHIPAPLIHLPAATLLPLASVHVHIMEDAAAGRAALLLGEELL